MNEFQKEYEYVETEGVTGLILTFCIMLITLDLLFGLIILTQGSRYLYPFPVLKTLFQGISIGYLVFAVLTCLIFYRTQKYIAIIIAKILLLVRVIYFGLSYGIVFYFQLNDKRLIGPTVFQVKSQKELLINNLIVPLVYTLAFSIFWFIYFNISKKVKKKYCNSLQE